MSTIAERFAVRFSGLERAHGEYVVPEGAMPDANGKMQGKAITVRSAASSDLWQRHLSGDGEFGLGVVPIRDDATCVFGAIDVDVYPLDIHKLDADCRRKLLPLVTCRTKSGGAHLYLFMREPAPAELVRRKMMEWAVALGYAGVEVFPKQTRLASENDYGNWINMPYQGGARTTRYALAQGGKGLTASGFLDLAEERALTAEELDAHRMPPEATFGDQLLEAPPCLEVLARNGFPPGTRNNALFNMGVYLKKRFGDGWEVKLDEYNQAFMVPPLGHADVATIVKSLKKKSYTYRCKEQPICGACNKQICLTREHGVEGGNDDPGVVFGELIKIDVDPPVYIWDVNGARLQLEVVELMDQRMFQKIAVAVLNKWPATIRPQTWRKIIQDRLDKITVQKVPDDARRDGQLMSHLQDYCTSKVSAKNRDELLLGKPWTDDKGSRTYFRSADFLKHLQSHRVNGFNEKELYLQLREHGIAHGFFNLKGKGVNVWSIPAFERQTEAHDVPDTRVPEM